MKLQIFAVVLLLAHASGQSCSQYNVTLGPFIDGHTDPFQHLYGVHGSAFSATGQCIYTGSSGPCLTVAKASQVSPSYSDSGLLKVPGWHVGTAAVEDGVQTSNGGPATANSTGAVAFENCSSPDCTFSISITPLGIAYPPANIWHDQFLYGNTCLARSAAPCNSRDKSGCTAPPPQSPIIIDTTGTVGFLHGFSDPATACVLFDIKGNGKPLCVSWPTVGSGLGWLALPDADGNVTSGMQLFGNFTPQPNHPSPNPNGFLALAEYDRNTDLVIDKKDPVWKRLRIWIDTHCENEPTTPCVSRPGELHTLEEFKITNISLVYSADTFIDQWGNWFKFFTHINTKPRDWQHSDDTRVIYDVYLAAQ